MITYKDMAVMDNIYMGVLMPVLSELNPKVTEPLLFSKSH